MRSFVALLVFHVFFRGKKRRGIGGFFALFLMFYVMIYVSLQLEKGERFPFLFAFVFKEKESGIRCLIMIHCFCLLFYKAAGEKGNRKIHCFLLFFFKTMTKKRILRFFFLSFAELSKEKKQSATKGFFAFLLVFILRE